MRTKREFKAFLETKAAEHFNHGQVFDIQAEEATHSDRPELNIEAFIEWKRGLAREQFAICNAFRAAAMEL